MAKWRYGDADLHEKVGKIRKKSRKNTHAVEVGERFESDPETWQLGGDDKAFSARVVEVHKRYAFVSSEGPDGTVNTRDVWLGEVARKFLVSEKKERNFVAVGDRVLCAPDRSEQAVALRPEDLPKCVIQRVAPRQSRLARLDPHNPGKEHVLAANMDRLLIVASFLSPTVKWGLIDRYLVLAESENLEVVIALTKPDLLAAAKPEFIEDCNEKAAIYRSLGYTVIIIEPNRPHAESSDAAVELGKILAQGVTLLSGHSGVGKSSLTNLYRPEIEQMVEPDADIFYKGRHTTSFASFIRLATNGGYVIDTPGIRSFTFAEKSAIELSHCFVEFRPLLGQCKYRECRHLDEPGCLIQEAVEAGSISQWRYRSYLGILLGATGREGRIRDLPLDDFEPEPV